MVTHPRPPQFSLSERELTETGVCVCVCAALKDKQGKCVCVCVRPFLHGAHHRDVSVRHGNRSRPMAKLFSRFFFFALLSLFCLVHVAN